jgi:hypothetical protein
MKKGNLVCLTVLLVGIWACFAQAQEIWVSPTIQQFVPVAFGKEKNLEILLKESLLESFAQKDLKVNLTKIDFPIGYIYSEGEADSVYPLVVEIEIEKEGQTKKILFLNQEGFNLKRFFQEIAKKVGI